MTRYAPAGITYDVVCKGKWHLNNTFESQQTLAEQQTTASRAHQTTDNTTMQQTYGFSSWTSQDFGTAMAMDLGGWRSGPTTIPSGTINRQPHSTTSAFCAYLETITDTLLGDVMSQMTTSMIANTLIVRLSDHGEMGLAQGGMVEKEHQPYNETLLVPIVFSHPGLPQGAVCTGLAGLIDMVPTLADICGLTLPSGILLQGQSIAPAILAGASGSTYTQLQCESDDASAVIRGMIDNGTYNVICREHQLGGHPTMAM